MILERLRKSVLIILFCIILLMVHLQINFSSSTLAGQEMRTQVLYLAGIIDDDLRMNEYITRAELAKMLAKASSYKDSIGNGSMSSVFNDVTKEHPYASYIKLATEKGYLSPYLGGKFYPENNATLIDLIRGVLSLLGYTNEDFNSTNQITGRYEMYCSLDLDENVKLFITDNVTKLDCVNVIYNMLKTKIKSSSNLYGTTVFDMTTNKDGELNASGLVKTNMKGPYILRKTQTIIDVLPFPVETGNYFLNGSASSYEQIQREATSAGFAILYYNETTRTVYAYKEGTSLDTTVNVTSGYVTNIYYSATDNLTPNSVEIERARYYLGNSDVKFAFSYAGTVHMSDRIIFVYEKSSTYNDEDSTDDTTYAGTITSVYLYDTKYD